MLKLIETELLKLHRRKLLLLMLLAALIMPFFAMLLFRYKGETGIDPLEFYRWSAFGYTLFNWWTSRKTRFSQSYDSGLSGIS